jgi:hypothetical protein
VTATAYRSLSLRSGSTALLFSSIPVIIIFITDSSSAPSNPAQRYLCLAYLLTYSIRPVSTWPKLQTCTHRSHHDNLPRLLYRRYTPKP